MKRKLRRKKNKAAIERLVELLRDVLDSFGWYGIGPPVAREVAQGPQGEAINHVEDENEQEDYDEEAYEEPEYYFDPADVQGALAEAISAFIKEGLMEEFMNPKEAPTLAEIFGVLFGANSELRERAEYFEKLISGYADKAHIDDLKEAYNVLDSVVSEIGGRND